MEESGWLVVGHMFLTEKRSCLPCGIKSLMKKSSWRQGGVQTCLKRLIDFTVGYKSDVEK